MNTDIILRAVYAAYVQKEGFVPIDYVADAYMKAIDNPTLFKSGTVSTITLQKGINVIEVDGSSNIVTQPPQKEVPPQNL